MWSHWRVLLCLSLLIDPFSGLPAQRTTPLANRRHNPEAYEDDYAYLVSNGFLDEANILSCVPFGTMWDDRLELVAGRVNVHPYCTKGRAGVTPVTSTASPTTISTTTPVTTTTTLQPIRMVDVATIPELYNEVVSINFKFCLLVLILSFVQGHFCNSMTEVLVILLQSRRYQGFVPRVPEPVTGEEHSGNFLLWWHVYDNNATRAFYNEPTERAAWYYYRQLEVGNREQRFTYAPSPFFRTRSEAAQFTPPYQPLRDDPPYLRRGRDMDHPELDQINVRWAAQMREQGWELTPYFLSLSAAPRRTTTVSTTTTTASTTTATTSPSTTPSTTYSPEVVTVFNSSSPEDEDSSSSDDEGVDTEVTTVLPTDAVWQEVIYFCNIFYNAFLFSYFLS